MSVFDPVGSQTKGLVLDETRNNPMADLVQDRDDLVLIVHDPLIMTQPPLAIAGPYQPICLLQHHRWPASAGVLLTSARCRVREHVTIPRLDVLILRKVKGKKEKTDLHADLQGMFLI